MDLQALLCNIDELAPLFDANYDNDSFPRVGWEPERLNDSPSICGLKL